MEKDKFTEKNEFGFYMARQTQLRNRDHNVIRYLRIFYYFKYGCVI